MTERALEQVWELRHYAVDHTAAACGDTRPGSVTTSREHVTCEGCRAALAAGARPRGAVVAYSMDDDAA